MQFVLPAHLKGGDSVVPTPAVYRHLLIPFATAVFVKVPGGAYLSQRIAGSGYEIRQHHFFFDKPSLLYLNSSEPAIMISFMLEGALQCNLPHLGVIRLEKDQHQLIYLPATANSEAMFDTGVYCWLQVSFSGSFPAGSGPRHPFINSFLDGVKREPNVAAVLPAAMNSKKINLLIREILHCREDNGDRELFLDARVRDLLFQYIKGQSGGQYAAANPRESKMLLRIMAFINDNLDAKLNVEAIAREALISPSALQIIFRKQFGKSVHQAVLDRRMQKAMELITGSDLPVGEIAGIVSDKSFSYFCASFTKYFGHPPGYYRKKSS